MLKVVFLEIVQSLLCTLVFLIYSYLKALTTCGLIIRSSYSPLGSPFIESFGNGKRNFSSDLSSESDLNDSGAWSTSSPTDTQEQAGADVNDVDEGDDSNQPAPQDPRTAAYEDGAHAEKPAG